MCLLGLLFIFFFELECYNQPWLKEEKFYKNSQDNHQKKKEKSRHTGIKKIQKTFYKKKQNVLEFD